MVGIASFRPGVQSGNNGPEDYPLTDLRAIADNFKKFSSGERPFYRPYISLNHDDGLAFGRVTNAALNDVDGEPTLVLDGNNIPLPVGSWINSGQLTAPSIEFWPAGTFIGPDGQPVNSPVLKCLTLLGNKPPAVKGLPDLPIATFAHRDAIVRRFDGAAVPDRKTVIDQLMTEGMDVAGITDAIPHAFLIVALDAIRKAKIQTTRRAEYVTPVSVEFTDPALSRQFNALREQTARELRDSIDRRKAIVAGKVREFRDEMTGAGQAVAFMSAAQFQAVEPRLLKLDDVAVRKFADGQATGTVLEEAFAKLRAVHARPVRMPSHTAGETSLTPQRRLVLLKATPIGRAVLARQRT